MLVRDRIKREVLALRKIKIVKLLKLMGKLFLAQQLLFP
jgi:hypothetical protein